MGLECNENFMEGNQLNNRDKKSNSKLQQQEVRNIRKVLEAVNENGQFFMVNRIEKM